MQDGETGCEGAGGNVVEVVREGEGGRGEVDLGLSGGGFDGIAVWRGGLQAPEGVRAEVEFCEEVVQFYDVGEKIT